MTTAAEITSRTTSPGLDPDAQRVIEEQRARRLSRLATRDRATLVVSLGLFLAVAGTLALLIPSHRSPSAVTGALLLVAYAVAFRLDFEVGSGSAVPTQLILVPMLFVLPIGTVPLAVAAGILVGSAVEYARGTLHIERVFLRLVDSWHAVGPALVLGLAGEAQPDLRRWPVYLGALGAQFALDYGSTVIRQWATLGVPPRLHLHTMGSVYVIDAGLAPVGLAVAFASTRSSAGVLLALPLVALLAVFARERRVRIDHELELRDAYRGTAFLLGDVVEADDAYTGEHSRDVVELTLAVADELGLSSRERRDAEFAALLHDVGKVRVPNEIINKPGKLTPEERAIIERHTIEGEQMLLRVGGLLGEIGRIVRACHEKYDGTGYPDRVAGEDIPIIARIVACCDAFNAMTSDRSYRKALPVSEAMAELRRSSGSQFDPRVVDALLASFERDAKAA
ncbi:MAG TPA: HD-GYP domain-containing protein [Gaiellaceae bacterium]|nr:HD-GYP domain-containing protein [Gaiellaceae bacterium]